jgi:hypothetical protein
LPERDSRQPALLALLRAGDAGVEALIDRLEGDALPRAEELRILRVLARLCHPSSQAALLGRLSSSEPARRHAVVVGLVRCSYGPSKQESAVLAAELLRDVRLGGWLLRSLSDLGAHGHWLLAEALNTELHRCRERILLLLECLHAGSAIREARQRYWAGSARERALALELLDSILSPSLQDLTFPLLEGQTIADALAGMPPTLVPRSLAAPERVLDILEGRTYSSVFPWLRTCAFYSIDRTGNGFNDVRVQINDFTAMTDSATMEKVLALKGVEIFAGTPSDVLLQLANSVDEIRLTPGEELFKQGDLGTSMFVIAEGLVRVHKKEQTIVELGRREIVGELAALDPEPRSASVSAIEPTLLYRIDQEMLRELMVDHPEIVQGVIRELAKRLRNTTAAYEAI